jgi:hypothetical protein
VRRAPPTDELIHQMIESLRGFEAAWFYCLYTGQCPGRPQRDGTIKVRIIEVVEWCGSQRNMSQRWGKVTPQSVGLTLTHNPRGDREGFGFDKFQQQELHKQGRVQYMTIPTLTQCREIWDKHRFKVEWNNDTSWDIIDMEP